jgi:hypothetical protein
VLDLYDGADVFGRYLFSIFLFLDATGNDANDIQPMSIPAILLKIKDNEKEKDN